MKEMIKNQLKKFINQFINGIYFVIGVFVIVGLSVYASTQLSNVENGQTLTAGTLNGIINWINNEGASKEYIDNNFSSNKVPVFYGERHTSVNVVSTMVHDMNIIDNFNSYSNGNYTIPKEGIYEVCGNSGRYRSNAQTVSSWIRFNGEDLKWLYGSHADSANRWQLRSYNCVIIKGNVGDIVSYYVGGTSGEYCDSTYRCSLFIKWLSNN